MGSWGKVLIVVLLTSYTSVRTDSVTGESNANQAVECSITECEQLRNRIETLEVAVRGIISAMASQTTGQLALVNKILGRNVALRDIVSSATAGRGVSNNETLRNDTSNIEQQEKNYSSQLKTALKCSLAHLLDINSSAEPDFKTSDTIQASLSTNNALEITWSAPSTECLKVSSGVWLRVFESGEKQLVPPSAGAYLSIPPRCWKKTKASQSIVLPRPSAGAAKENSCSLELKNDLIPCLVYTVEVIPNYQSLKGRPLLTEIILPPSNDNSTARRELLISLIAESNSLALKWKDNSGCAPRLTAVSLKVFPDGKLETAQVPLSFDIPRRCLQFESDQNVFSLKLSRDHACPVQLKLDACRKYILEVKSEYQNKFARPPILWDTFTAKKELYYQNNTKNIENSNCSDNQFSCFDNCIPSSWVCDGEHDCVGGEDEFHCSISADDQCNIGFPCGSKCTPESQVCDGKYDCFDGSDEMGENCEFKVGYSSFTCYELKSHSGRLYDEIKGQPLRWSKSVVLISAENENTIWLSINSFRTHHTNFLKVYDGPYSNSPLLLSHSGSTNPPSVRSSSNKLYLEFPSYSYADYGIQMFYTTMNNTGTGQPFVPGCGGYVFGEGDIYSQSSFASSTVNITKCVWFVDALESDRTIRMTRRVLNTKETATSTMSDNHLYVGPIMTVYDGWGLSGQVLYDERAIPIQRRKSMVYSISHKTTVQFLMPTDATNNGIVHWDVYSMKAPKYIKVEMNGSSGTLKPPGFEEDLRDDNTDYHWHLVTTPNSTIQLLFAHFKTQESNYVQVFDGPTVKSYILLDKSGEDVLPFLVTSSTNELLVRYMVTRNNIAYHRYGFLAVYSSV